MQMERNAEAEAAFTRAEAFHRRALGADPENRLLREALDRVSQYLGKCVTATTTAKAPAHPPHSGHKR